MAPVLVADPAIPVAPVLVADPAIPVAPVSPWGTNIFHKPIEAGEFGESPGRPVGEIYMYVLLSAKGPASILIWFW